MPPPPPPSEGSVDDIDFTAFIHTSTPFYAEQPGCSQMQISPPPLASQVAAGSYRAIQSQSQVSNDVVPSPMFIGSEGESEGEGEGGSVVMSNSLSLSLVVGERGRLREGEMDAGEDGFSGGVGGETQVQRGGCLGEIPDSDDDGDDGESENEGVCDLVMGEVGGEGVVGDFVMAEIGGVVGQVFLREEENDGDDRREVESVYGVDTSGLVTGGADGGIRNAESVKDSVNDFRDGSNLKDSHLSPAQDEEREQATTNNFQGSETEEKAREGAHNGRTTTTIDATTFSSEGSHALHMLAPRMKYGHDEPAQKTAIQKAQVDALGALDDAIKDANDVSPFAVSLPLQGKAEMHQKKLEEEGVIFHNSATEDFGENAPERSRKPGNFVGDDSKRSEVSSKFLLDELFKEQSSTEMEDVQSAQASTVEDEVSLIPTENTSQIAQNPAGMSSAQKKSEDLRMKDTVTKDSVLSPEHITSNVDLSKEVPVPRASRRQSSRKSEVPSAAEPKEGRRTSSRGKSQLSVEIPVLQYPDESVNHSLKAVEEAKSSSKVQIDLVMDKKSEKKNTRKASSTRKTSQRGIKEASVPLLPALGLEQSKVDENNIVTPLPDVVAEVLISEETSKKAPTTRKKSQRGAQAEPKVLLQLENPKILLDEHTEVSKGRKVLDLSPEPSAELSGLKKSQGKTSSASQNPSSTSSKRQLDDEADELSEINTDAAAPSVPMPTNPVSKTPLPTKSVVQRPHLQAREGSQKKEVLIAELKAIKIASIQARTAWLEAEIAAKRAKVEEVTKELTHPAAETVKRHIKLLHDYNDIRDVGQALVGMIADNRGVRIGELYEEFGVGLKD